MDKKEKNQNKLILIPKTEKYIEYMLQVIIKLPRRGRAIPLQWLYRCHLIESLKANGVRPISIEKLNTFSFFLWLLGKVRHLPSWYNYHYSPMIIQLKALFKPISVKFKTERLH